MEYEMQTYRVDMNNPASPSVPCPKCYGIKVYKGHAGLNLNNKTVGPKP